MESDNQLDLVLISLYNSTSTEQSQSLITKYLPLLLQSLNPSANKTTLNQQKLVKTINDILIFIKKHTELQLPYAQIVPLVQNTKIPLQKNVSAIFLKIALERNSSDIDLQQLMSNYNLFPAPVQTTLLSSYLKQISHIDPKIFIETLQNHIDSVLNLPSTDLTGFPNFILNNLRLFHDFPDIFLKLFMKLETKNAKEKNMKNQAASIVPFEIDDFFALDAESIVKSIWSNFDHYTPIQINRSLYLLSKLSYPFPDLDKIVSNSDMPFGLECLDRQLPLYQPEDLEPVISHIVTVITEDLETKGELKISILRSLMKKCPLKFKTNFALFKKLFNSDGIARSTRSSILYLFSSFIEPSKRLFDFLEKEIYDGEVIGISLLRQIYPFSESRSKVIACLMISDPNFSDECRIMLHSYRIVENNGFRTCINESEEKADPPTITDFFSVVINDSKIHRYLVNSSATRNVCALFNFACICKMTYPIQYSFIIECLDMCPNASSDISAFLVRITHTLPRDETIDVSPFVKYLKRETDSTIIEMISRFLAWTECDVNVDEISKDMKGPQKVAFMSHFGCPFDEAVKMLSTAGQSNLAKNCLMAMAKRGKLNKAHFDILFPTLSKDPMGIEILSTIAKTDVNLCEQLTAKFFEVPLINTEHVEVVVSGARKLSKIVQEDFLVSHIEKGMKNDKSRRNSAIFLLYFVDSFLNSAELRIPRRLWFCTRTLLFCCGAENGVVRTSGLIGLNILYRKINENSKEKGKEIEDALYGRTNPPEEQSSVQTMSGQSRAAIVQNLLRIASSIPVFMDFLITLIEPDFIIFTGIEIPTATFTSDEERQKYVSVFFFNSFSPNESAADSFRRLWRWATDGGKKLSIPELIDWIYKSTDENNNNSADKLATGKQTQSFETQQMTLNCIQEIVSRMSQEQTSEYFKKLCEILMKLVFSPVNEMSVSGITGLDKLVQKLISGPKKSISTELQNYLISLCAKLFDTRQNHLVVFATKWSNDIIPSISQVNDMIIIYRSLFSGLGSTPSISNMLSGPTWPVFSKSVFRCCELELPPFLDCVKEQIKSMIVLDSQRYGAYYALDSIFRSPSRIVIAKELLTILPSLFHLIASERSDIVVKFLISVIVHGLQCYLYGNEETFPYEDYIMKLFFDDQKVEICGMLMKAISRDCPDYLSSDISPFIVFASCFDVNEKAEVKPKKAKQQQMDDVDESEEELKSREFLVLLRDEISLSVHVNSNPEMFIDFAFNRGILSTQAAFYKPIGARCLLKVISAMSSATKTKLSKSLIDKILPILSTRLFPYKENLIDCITELIGFCDITDNLVDEMKKCAMRPKSVFRASAIRCLNKIIRTTEYKNIKNSELLDIMIDAVANGTIVAQKAACECADLVKDEPNYNTFLNELYKKMNEIELSNCNEYCVMVLNLPNHEVPSIFDKQKFIKLISGSKERTPAIDEFVDKIEK